MRRDLLRTVIVSAACLQWLAACSTTSGPDCIDETRSLAVTARLTGTLAQPAPGTAGAPPYVITQVFTRRTYTGATGWEDLYEVLGEERAYIDVHTSTHPNGQLRGDLKLDFPDWRTFQHAYCS